MKVSREELVHIAKLANLNFKEEELDDYLANLDDILNFTNVINRVNVEELKETIGTSENSNVFRKDEVKAFDNQEGILENAPEKELNMFKIPKVI